VYLTSSSKTGATVLSTVNGLLRVVGVGKGAVGNDAGVVLAGGVVKATGTGGIEVTGTGGANTQSGDDGVLFTGGGLMTAGGNVEISAAAGNGFEENNYGFAEQGTGAAVTVTGGGSLTITGTGSAGTGVVLGGTRSAAISTVNGPLSITGTGVGQGDGISLTSVEPVRTTGTGTLTLLGSGGNGVNSDYGVSVVGGAVTTVSAPIVITGYGEGTGLDNRGVNIDLSGTVQAGGGGTVTIVGYGADGPGVLVDDGGQVLSVNGTISVTGQVTSGGALAYGVVVTGPGTTITSTGTGSVGLVGQTAGGLAAPISFSATFYGSDSGTVRTATGNITLQADGIDLGLPDSVTSTAAAPTADLTFAPSTPGQPIVLGGPDVAGHLVYTDADNLAIDQGEFALLTIGGPAATGAVTTGNAVAFGTPVTVQTAGGITVGTGTTLSDATPDPLTLSAGSTGTTGTGLVQAGTLDLVGTTVGAAGTPLRFSAPNLYTAVTSALDLANAAGTAATVYPAATGTLFDLAGGTFDPSAANVFPITSTLQVDFGATLALGAYAQSVGQVVVNGGTITGATTLTSANTILGSGGSVSAVLAGANGLAKSTTGTLTLTAANAYTGGTTVTGGTLLVDNAGGSGTGGGGVAVSGGTLGGTGTVSGTVTVTGTGTLLPGPGGAAGVLSMTDLSMAAGAAFAAGIGGGSAAAYDQAAVTDSGPGSVSLAGATLNLFALNGYTPKEGDQYEIIADAGTGLTGAFTAGAGSDAGITGTLLGQNAVISTNFLGSGLAAVVSYAYGPTGDSVLVKILSPTFGNLNVTSPITYGTPTDTVSGTLSSNTTQGIPVGETVQVTINGVTRPATLGAGGQFSVAFPTGGIPASGTPYPVTFYYPGDATFASATSTSTLTVAPAQPTFTGLTAPVITFGGSSVTVSGTLAANAGTQTVPSTEHVLVTLNGVPQSAILTTGDTFSTTFATATLPASGTPYPVTLGYAGDPNFAPAAGGTTVTVNPAHPAFTGVTAPTITYGTATATVTGTLAPNANGQPVPTGASEVVTLTVNGTPYTGNLNAADQFGITFPAGGLAAGSYPVALAYAGDTDFTAAAGSTTLTVTQAPPTFTGLSAPTVTYGTATATVSGTLSSVGQPVPAGETVSVTLAGVTQPVPLSGTDQFSATFSTAARAAAAYPVSLAYAGDANFAAATGSTTLTVAKATPTLTGLSAPTITYGTATTLITGTLTANAGGQPLNPGESVSVTVNGATQAAALGTTGQFSVAFTTATVPASGTPYPVTVSYAGDPDFAAATGSTTLTVGLAQPTFTGLSAPTVAYGSATATITGTLAPPAGGQPVPAGEPVSVKINGVTQSGFLNGTGRFTATVSTAGLAVSGSPYTVSVTYGGDANFLGAAGSTTVTVTPAQPTFTGLSAPVIAPGTATATFTGTLASPAGVPLVPAGEAVTLTLNGTPATGTLTLTGGADTFSITVPTAALAASGTAYPVTLGYAGDPNFAPATAATTLSVSAYSLTTSTIGVVSTTMPAGGTDTVTLQVESSGGQALADPGLAVAFGLSAGQGSFGPSVTYEGNGLYEASFTSQVAGTDTFTATIAGQAVTSTAPVVTVTAAAVSLSTSAALVVPPTVQLGGTVTVTLQAKDPYGNDETTGGLAVGFKLANTTGGQGTFGPTTDHGNGTYTATFTGTADGTNAVVATIGGTAVSTTAAVTVSGAAASAAKSVVTLAPAGVAAGGTTTVTLQAKDATGKPETAGGLTVSFKLGTGAAAGTFGPVTDHGNGTYTATFTGTLAGTNTVIGVIGTAALTTAAPTVTVTAGAAVPADATVTLSAGTVAAGSTVTVTVQPRDAYGNAVKQSGLSVGLSYGSGGGQGTFSAVTYAASTGAYTATFKGTTAGATTVVANIGGTPVPGPPAITVTPGAASTVKSYVSAPSGPVAAGTTEVVTVQAEDAYGNLITTGGLKVTFGLGSTAGAAGTFSPTTDVGNGTYTAVFTGTTAGTNTIVGAIAGTKLTSAAAPVTVTAGAFSPAKSVATVSAATVASGGTVTVTLQAEDAYGNKLTTGGLAVAFGLGTGAATGTFAGTTDNGNGTYTAVLTGVLVGTNTVTASINGSAVTSAAPAIKVTPGAASVATSVVTASRTTVAVGSTITLTLQAEDAAGNNETTGGLSVLFYLAAGSTGTGTFGTVTNVGNGTYTVTFKATAAGTAELSAKIAGVPLTTAPVAVAVT
jgi:adhesin/invasin